MMRWFVLGLGVFTFVMCGVCVATQRDELMDPCQSDSAKHVQTMSMKSRPLTSLDEAYLRRAEVRQDFCAHLRSAAGENTVRSLVLMHNWCQGKRFDGLKAYDVLLAMQHRQDPTYASIRSLVTLDEVKAMQAYLLSYERPPLDEEILKAVTRADCHRGKGDTDEHKEAANAFLVAIDCSVFYGIETRDIPSKRKGSLGDILLKDRSSYDLQFYGIVKSLAYVTFLQSQSCEGVLRSYVVLKKWAHGWRPDDLFASDVWKTVHYLGDARYDFVRALVAQGDVDSMRGRLMRKPWNAYGENIIESMHFNIFKTMDLSSDDEKIIIEMQEILHSYIEHGEGI